MKKIFIVLVVALIFIGCSKPQREVYAEFELLSNPDGAARVIFHYTGGVPYSQYTDLITPVPVGTTWTTETFLYEKGTNTIATVNTDNLQTPTIPYYSHQWQVKFYVDGNLEETRTNGGVSSGINFIVP